MPCVEDGMPLPLVPHLWRYKRQNHGILVANEDECGCGNKSAQNSVNRNAQQMAMSMVKEATPIKVHHSIIQIVMQTKTAQTEHNYTISFVGVCLSMTSCCQYIAFLDLRLPVICNFEAIMNYLSEEDLAIFFERNNNRYVNSTGMEIGLSEESGIWTFLSVSRLDEGRSGVSISTEEDAPRDFLEGFKIEGWRDIDQLDYTSSWMRYLNGAATITINPLDPDAEISFRIVKSKTIVFSLDLHFYDEVHEHLTMPEDFQQYFLDHEKQLFEADSNRYKF